MISSRAYFNGETLSYSKPKRLIVNTTSKDIQLFDVPNWAKEAIWYNIFPDRFYNGNHYNDPIFNEFGLTTQFSAILQIGTIKDKKSTKRGYYRIKFVKQWNTITKENIPLLQLLDCLRFFKNIPDTNPADSSKKLLELLSKLSEIQHSKIKKLALKYTPQTIALLGAMLEVLNPNEDVLILQMSLNYQTFYNLSIPQEILPNQKKWNIR